MNARKTSTALWHITLMLATLFLSSGSSGQPALGSIPPTVLNQLKSLPPDQARLLAQQYGVDLEAYLGTSTIQGSVGQPGSPLSPAVPEGMDSPTSIDPAELEGSALAGARIEPLDPGERYGLGFFSADVSSFAPVDNAPVPQDYRLGPGDQLQVLFLGPNSTELTLTVDRFGEIVLPEIGRLAVAGQRFEDAAETLRAKVASARIGVEALVTMGRLRAINVMLAGEVAVPGARSLSGMARLTHALYAAGGVTELGSLRAIEVKRDGKTVACFDAYDLLVRGDGSGDVNLRDGDVVFVPTVASIAAVGGAARRPGVYELANNERLADLLAMAGGVTERGRMDRVLLERESPSGTPEILELTSAALMEAVQPGDRLRIQFASERFLNRVALRGAVQRPSVYGHHEGMRLSDLLRSADGDLLEETDYDYALVTSVDAATGRLTLRQFSPAELFDGVPEADLSLNPRDVVILFPRAESVDSMGSTLLERRLALLSPIVDRLEAQAGPDQPAAVVTLVGAVHAPGRYPLPGGEGYGLSKLIAAAGGFRDDAYLRALEIQRPVTNATGDVSLTSRKFRADIPGEIDNVILKGRDRILVRAVPNWRPSDAVVLEGEVRFPGRYVLLPGEKLGDLLQRVGGLTPKAYPYGAVFSAARAAEQEREETQRFVSEVRRSFATQALTQEEKVMSFAELEQALAGLLDRESVGRVAIDLPRILAGDEASDVVLSDGDRLFVPPRAATISVLGEVYRPGSFAFESGLSLKDYLALSAGATPRAEVSRVYIVRADGRVDRPNRNLFRFQLTDTQLRPGDSIVVPVDSSYRSPLVFWTEITQVAYQTGIAAAAVLRN